MSSVTSHGVESNQQLTTSGEQASTVARKTVHVKTSNHNVTQPNKNLQRRDTLLKASQGHSKSKSVAMAQEPLKVKTIATPDPVTSGEVSKADMDMMQSLDAVVAIPDILIRKRLG